MCLFCNIYVQVYSSWYTIYLYIYLVYYSIYIIYNAYYYSRSIYVKWGVQKNYLYNDFTFYLNNIYITFYYYICIHTYLYIIRLHSINRCYAIPIRYYFSFLIFIPGFQGTHTGRKSGAAFARKTNYICKFGIYSFAHTTVNISK